MTHQDRQRLASFVRRVAKRIEKAEYVGVITEFERAMRDGEYTGEEVLTLRYNNVTKDERMRRKATERAMNEALNKCG